MRKKQILGVLFLGSIALIYFYFFTSHGYEFTTDKLISGFAEEWARQPMSMIIIFGILILALMTQWWFWVLCALACAFSCLANIFHFEILWAMGSFFLMCVSVIAAMFTNEFKF